MQSSRPRPLRYTAVITVFMVIGASCGSAPAETEVAVQEPTSTPVATPVFEPTPIGAPVSGSDVPTEIVIQIPIVPAIALPDLSELSESGQLVSLQLGELITSPVSGIEVVTASCQGEGGALTYSGSTGSDIFEIDEDGAGTYRRETTEGLVTVDVNSDGSGEFYDETNGLLTIKVDASGAGEYYRSSPDLGLTTVETTSDGSGVYYERSPASLKTVTLTPDGDGQFYAADESTRVTILARADGSGTYTLDEGLFVFDGVTYRAEQIDRSVTIVRGTEGDWQLTDDGPDAVVAVVVDADGAGSFVRSGRSYLDVSFDADGVSGDTTVTVPPAPVFVIQDRFPSIGRLGSLAPPCATVIRFDSSLLFDYNSSNLRPEAEEVLTGVAVALNDANQAIEVNGHTDARGDASYNLELSLDRAQAVEQALRALGLGVEIAVNGFGEEQPVAPNELPDGTDDEAGRAQNRRVEIVIRD